MSSSNTRQQARLHALQRLVIDLGRKDFDERYPDLTLSPVVALIAAYEEEDNIGAVLEAMPATACGMEVTTLVVVDGGEDKTAKVALDHGAVTFVFPENLGHGVALRVGYDLCISGGSQYVVTLDADGQNDPAELESLLQPVVDDEADFVVASRRLGTDETSDVVRKTGVVVFATLLNLLAGTKLTDTSTGYRALRTAVLADIVGRLEQEQYQTAEVLITAARRGWRIGERPTVWHPRASGSSKKGSNLFFGISYMRVVLHTWWRERRR